MFEIIYRVSPYQDFNIGSLVTYRNEKRLEYIKENILSRTDFFYLKEVDIDFHKCVISNGIDIIKTTTDQLVEVVAYAHSIEKPNVSKNNSLVSLINNNNITGESYILENQILGIFLEESTFTKEFFSVEFLKTSINDGIKNYRVARFIESKLSEII